MGEMILTGLTVPEVAAAFQRPADVAPHVVRATGSPAFFDEKAWKVGRVALGLRWSVLGDDGDGFVQTMREVGQLAAELFPTGQPVYRLSRQTPEALVWFTLYGEGRLSLFATQHATFGLMAEPDVTWETMLGRLLTGATEDEVVILERFAPDGSDVTVASPHRDSLGAAPAA